MAGAAVTLLYSEAALEKIQKQDKSNQGHWRCHGVSTLAWDYPPTHSRVKETILLPTLPKCYFQSLLSVATHSFSFKQTTKSISLQIEDHIRKN